MRALFIISLCAFTLSNYAQKNSFVHQTKIKPVAFCKTSPLRDIEPLIDLNANFIHLEEAHNALTTTNKNKSTNPKSSINYDIQDYMGKKSSPPLLQVFDGLGPMDYTCINPDTEGDVGPNHYMQMVKRSFAIWDKEGNMLYGPADNKTLWSNLPGPWHDNLFTDPVIIYDHFTDRWLASNMVYDAENINFWEVIAYSATPDPLGEWYCYAYETVYMPDYPKFGVWDDAIYLTTNNGDVFVTNDFMGSSIWAFNKDDLMNGDPEPNVITFLTEHVNHDFYLSPNSFFPADIDGIAPPNSSPHYLVYMKDDDWGFDFDHLSIWECDIDWATPENSTLSESTMLEVEPFTTDVQNYWFIPQPGTSTTLDAMANRLMYRLQYRNFEEYEMMTINHTIKLDSNFHAGIRWYELRNYGDGWNIHQQSTYAPDEDNRWMGSISMDNRGNMALGYSVSSSTVYPSIRITGRFDTDILGTMTLEEIEVASGEGYQYNNGRWGDYSYMTIDPLDDQTFWYTQMYMQETNPLGWETKICSFKIAKELSMNTDTLFFNTIDECLNGKILTLKNNSWDSIKINSVEQVGYLMNVMWYVDIMPVSLPYILPVGDSINLLVKADITVDQINEDYIYDIMNIVANETYQYDIVLAFNEVFISGITNKNIKDYKVRVYPNPLSDKTNISFSLDNSANVSIKIIDQQLKVVASVLSNKKLKKGEHSFEWNSRQNKRHKLSPGIYYCSITIEDNPIIVKMVIQ